MSRPVPRPGVMAIDPYVPGKSAAPGSGRTFKLGASVKVTVDKVDRFKRQVDFRVHSESPKGAPRGPERRKGGR